ncbi:transposase [Corynebacterium glutamicum MB001]|nr:transposase [Corynebacterium glutamicum MB001]ASW14765.1 transposase [Corynebacterium glutamicum]
MDGTFFNTTCLLVAYTFDHVVAWRWCTKEDAYNYTHLFDQLQPPLIVTTDGQKRRTQSHHHDLADNENPTLPRPRQTQRPKTRHPKTRAELAEKHSGVSP